MSTDMTTSLDEPLSLSKPNQEAIFNRIDELLSKARAERDPLVAIDGITQLTGFERIVGLGKAKLLWTIKKEWDSFGLEEDFRDFVQEHTGIVIDTIDRYVLAWDMYATEKIPDQFRQEIMGRTMRDQVEIAKIADRVELTDQDWQDIASASNGREIIDIKTKLTGITPRKSGLTIILLRNGDLQVKDSKGKRIFIGYLELNSDEEIIQKAVERIIRSAGVLKA